MTMISSAQVANKGHCHNTTGRSVGLLCESVNKRYGMNFRSAHKPKPNVHTKKEIESKTIRSRKYIQNDEIPGQQDMHND
jgi:hypothetical protein